MVPINIPSLANYIREKDCFLKHTNKKSNLHVYVVIALNRNIRKGHRKLSIVELSKGPTIIIIKGPCERSLVVTLPPACVLRSSH